MPTQDQVYNPSQSILETYINARKDQLDRQRQAQVDATSKANVDSEIEARKNTHDESMRRLDEEHKINLSNIALQQAQLQAAHLAAKEHIRKSILEGTTPIPPPSVPQMNNVAPTSSDQQPNPLSQFQASIPAQNAPLISEGVTLQGNEYNTPQQSIEQAAPIQQNKINQAGQLAYTESRGKEQGVEDVKKQPGGTFDQQLKLEQNKLDNTNTISAADRRSKELIARNRDETSIIVGRGHDATKMAAARISEATKGQLTPDELETRMLQLKFGEGAPMGKTPNDLLAATGLRQAGGTPVSPTAVKNLQRMSPLEHFGADLNNFADKYLSDNKAGSVLSTIKLNAPYSEAKNEFNKLLLNSTNIAVSVEGASGRILMAQINVAKDFIANKYITKEQLKSNADKLMQLTLNAAESQLGNLKPSQRVELMDHWNMSTLAANESKRWKLASPAQNGNSNSEIPPKNVIDATPEGHIITSPTGKKFIKRGGQIIAQ